MSWDSVGVALPTPYRDIIHNRIVVITGVGRSGTTILSKLLGSYDNCYCLFEPAIFKYLLPKAIDNPSLKPVFWGTLVEDYLLPLVQGRGYSTNPGDWTYHDNFLTRKRLGECWGRGRRAEALEYVIRDKPTFFVKSNELQPLWRDIVDSGILPGVGFLHIVRDGRDVTRSVMARGWYSDTYCSEMVDWTVEKWVTDKNAWIATKKYVPWFVEEKRVMEWVEWNLPTRIAYVWARLVREAGRMIPNAVRYEELVSGPREVAGVLERMFGLIGKHTSLTTTHIESVLDFEKRDYGGWQEKYIEESVREEFWLEMKENGYG